MQRQRVRELQEQNDPQSTGQEGGYSALLDLIAGEVCYLPKPADSNSYQIGK